MPLTFSKLKDGPDQAWCAHEPSGSVYWIRREQRGFTTSLVSFTDWVPPLAHDPAQYFATFDQAQAACEEDCLRFNR